MQKCMNYETNYKRGKAIGLQENVWSNQNICTIRKEVQLGLFFKKIIIFRILIIFNTHIEGEERRFFKETYNGVYPKGPNLWIHSTDFKPL